jgi:hypothetical protein
MGDPKMFIIREREKMFRPDDAPAEKAAEFNSAAFGL